MNHFEKAVDYHHRGFNCCQSVLAAFSDVTGLSEQASFDLAGGFGAAVAEFYADRGILVPMLRFGIPDAFIEQGTRKELLELCGLLPEQIAERVRKAWGNL